MNDDIAISLRPLVKIFEILAIRYLIGGSVASSYHGAMRSTMDVDIVAEIESCHVKMILSSLEKDFYASESAMREAIHRKSSFNLIHLGTSFKLDIFISQGRKFDEMAFQRSRLGILGTPGAEIKVPIASLEDIILAKLEWYKAGNEVSERQWEDLQRLRKLNFSIIDWNYLEQNSTQRGVSDLLTRLKDSVVR